MEILLEHLGKGLYYIILISMPIVLTAAGIGLVVGILQAVTQVQEQTIAAAPKILGVFLVILIGGAVIMRVLNNYLEDSINLAMDDVPKQGYFAAAPLGLENPDQKIKDFFNEKKFLRIVDKPNIKEMLDKPLDAPYLKNDKAKKTAVYSPAPPIPDANISEEIENYKRMMESDNQTRSKSSKEQKAPMIPPLSEGKTNPTISLLPDLDEPPSIDPSDLEDSSTIASTTQNNNSVTGAAAYVTPEGRYKFDYDVKGSTIIINNNEKISYNPSPDNKHSNNPNKGAIIIESK
ncbi:MAG: flagellar biosynthetic protein FliQ [Cyanobacteriota bacterium]